MYPLFARAYVITTSPPCHHLRCDVIISNVIIFAEMLSPLYTAQLESGIHRKCKCQLAKILLSTDSSCCNNMTIFGCHHRHHWGSDVDPEKPMMLNLKMARRPLHRLTHQCHVTSAEEGVVTVVTSGHVGPQQLGEIYYTILTYSNMIKI